MNKIIFVPNNKEAKKQKQLKLFLKFGLTDSESFSLHGPNKKMNIHAGVFHFLTAGS